MLDAVEAATKKVIEMGYVDPKQHRHQRPQLRRRRRGVHRHALAAVRGGRHGRRRDAISIRTSARTGAGRYQVPGGSGANGNRLLPVRPGPLGLLAVGQARVYMFESALTHVPRSDGAVPDHARHGRSDGARSRTASAFYNALRYNGKNAVLLAYPGEGHGLRGLANRKDLTIRYFQFFDHYLKGAPAPKWMTDGVPFLQKDANREPGVVP